MGGAVAQQALKTVSLIAVDAHGELGKRVYESVSKEAWAAWLKHQTMLVNENRLNLADQRARKYLAVQMEKHFFGEGAADMGYVPPAE